MNDMQKMLKKMVVAVISEDENLEERTIDTKISDAFRSIRGRN